MSERKKDKSAHKISTPEKTIKFIEDFFIPKSTYDYYTIKIIHYMYRNGLVHLYQPKSVKLRGNKKITWFIYRGKSFMKEIEINTDIGVIKFTNVNHLKLMGHPINKRLIYLPISIDCLYLDFENALKAYRDKLQKTKYLQRNWRTAVNAIIKPQWM